MLSACLYAQMAFYMKAHCWVVLEMVLLRLILILQNKSRLAAFVVKQVTKGAPREELVVSNAFVQEIEHFLMHSNLETENDNLQVDHLQC